jgi:hypothetical protein
VLLNPAAQRRRESQEACMLMLSLFVGLISLLFGVISGVWNGLALLK